MEDDRDYTGTHAVVLPKDYLQSLEAASELYEEELSSAVSDLEVDSLAPDRRWHMRFGVTLGALVWLAPACWITCS